MATKETIYPKCILSVKKRCFCTWNGIFLFNFALLKADSHSTGSRHTFISVVTLQKIWYVLYFLATAVKSQTEAQQMICFPNDPSGLYLSACGWVITRVWGWRKLAYLISWASDSAEWDREVSAVPELPPKNCCSFQCLSLSPAWGRWRNDKLNHYLSERIEKLLWRYLHGLRWRRLMWNLTANKSGQGAECQGEQPWLRAAGGGERGSGKWNTSSSSSLFLSKPVPVQIMSTV